MSSPLNISFSQCPFLLMSFLLYVSPSHCSLNVLSMSSPLNILPYLFSTPNGFSIQYLLLFFQCSSVLIYNHFNVVSSQFLHFFPFPCSLLSISSLLNVLLSQHPLFLMSSSLAFLLSQYLPLLIFFSFKYSSFLISFPLNIILSHFSPLSMSSPSNSSPFNRQHLPLSISFYLNVLPSQCLFLSMFSLSNLNSLIISSSQLFFINILHSQFLPLSTFFPSQHSSPLNILPSQYLIYSKYHVFHSIFSFLYAFLFQHLPSSMSFPLNTFSS